MPVDDQRAAGPQQRRHLLRCGAQQQPYQRGGACRVRAGALLPGEEGQQDRRDRGDGVGAPVALRRGDAEHHPRPRAQCVRGEVDAGGGVGGGGRVAPGDRGGQPVQRPLRLRRLPGARLGDPRAVGAVQHRPAGQPLREPAQHRRHGVGPGGGCGQALLGLRDPAQFGGAGLRHQLPHGSGHAGERGARRHLQQRKAVRLARLDQRARHGVVHGREAEAERGAAGGDEPGDVVVEVRAGARRVRDVHTGAQQQLAAEEIRVRVGHLRGVHPVHGDPGGVRPGDLPQGEVLPREERRERHGRRGRDEPVRHDVRFLHSGPAEWRKRTLRSRFPAT
ncbi:hypothetical protein GCM10020256_49630 [Streptomyces thermocoprophilus]